MLNIEVNRSAEGVERYFDRELTVSDYLMKEPGIWAGRGAKRLGLSGPIQRSQFVAILRNENPTTGKRLTARTNTSRCITDREIELFSKRHELIDTLSEERGSTPEEERWIARQERDSKTTKLFSGQAEVENWRQQMGTERWDSVTSERATEGPQLELPINPREVAVEAYFAKHSVARAQALTAEILRRACGTLSVGEVEQYVKGDRFIQLDGSHVTTAQAKLEEEELLDLVRGGRDTCGPMGRDFAFDPRELTDEQHKALEHILASRDLVIDVSGIAGAGKSHLLKKAAGAVVSVGKSIAIISPTDASVKELRKASFQARTFQGFQLRPECADVLVIDEASP